MLHRRKRVLDHILDIQIRPDLVQMRPQVDDLRIGQHDKLHARGRLVVVQLVLAGAVGEESVIVAAELGDEVAQGEDEAEDKLLVVGVGEWSAGRWGVAAAGDARSRLRTGGLARGLGPWCPAARVDALR